MSLNNNTKKEKLNKEANKYGYILLIIFMLIFIKCILGKGEIQQNSASNIINEDMFLTEYASDLETDKNKIDENLLNFALTAENYLQDYNEYITNNPDKTNIINYSIISLTNMEILINDIDTYICKDASDYKFAVRKYVLSCMEYVKNIYTGTLNNNNEYYEKAKQEQININIYINEISEKRNKFINN